jgi:hypothetical protein
VDKITDIESLKFKDSISVIVSKNFDVCDGEDGEDSSTIPSLNPSRHRKACRLAGNASVLETLNFYGMLEGGESHHIYSSANDIHLKITYMTPMCHHDVVSIAII